MQRLLFTLVLIFASIAAGYALRFLTLKAQEHQISVGGIAVDEAHLQKLRMVILKFAMFGLIPLSAMLSLWGLPSPDVRLLGLPLLGLLAWMAGGFVTLMAARMMKLPRTQQGSMFCCGTFTNIGAVGTLIAVFEYGESAIAITSLYRLLEELYFFGIACPVAAAFSKNAPQNGGFRFSNFRFEPVLKVILGALALGIALNLASVPRPEIFRVISSSAMITGTILFLVAIGMALRISSIGAYLAPALVVSVVKFTVVPVVVTGIAWMTGFGGITELPVLSIILILSAMPVAMNALVPPSLYKLDLDLANAAWIVSTVLLVVVLPVLRLLIV